MKFEPATSDASMLTQGTQIRKSNRSVWESESVKRGKSVWGKDTQYHSPLFRDFFFFFNKYWKIDLRLIWKPTPELHVPQSKPPPRSLPHVFRRPTVKSSFPISTPNWLSKWSLSLRKRTSLHAHKPSNLGFWPNFKFRKSWFPKFLGNN